MTGPGSCTLIGPERAATAARNAGCRRTARPPAARRRSGASGSSAAWSTRTDPSSSTDTPRMPQTPSATMPCRGSNDGSDGAAGSSAVRSSTKATASAGSRCGRLPIPVTVPSPKSGSGAISSCARLEGWRRLPLRSPVSAPREWLPTVPVGKSQPVTSEGRPTAGAGGEPGPWAFRIAWIVLPFTTGPLLSDALSSADDAFRITAAVGLWGLWRSRSRRRSWSGP